MKGAIKLAANLPLWFTRELGPGDEGEDVLIVQRMLLCFPTEVYDGNTVAAVRGFQVATGIGPSGWVDEETARVLGPRASDHLLPDWFKGCDLHPGDPDYEVVISKLLQVSPKLGANALGATLRRFQGNHGLPATGVIDETTARLLGAVVH